MDAIIKLGLKIKSGYLAQILESKFISLFICFTFKIFPVSHTLIAFNS